MKINPPTEAQLYAGVMDHAHRHYEDGGWDVVAETYTEGELIATVLAMREGRPAATVAEAIAALEPLVDIWADREADARNSREF